LSEATIERNHRKVYQGLVVANKGDKTITVVVQTYKTDPTYKKRIKYTKKYYAHDETNEANVGDTVRIMETRPLSKTKHFRLLSIVSKSVQI
jgi:small subunit ribosomal protein S17